MSEHERSLHWIKKSSILIDTSDNNIVLQDYDGGSKITLWHNGERWIVRHDERALGDHNNFECVDQWELRSPSEALEQYTAGLEDA